LVAINAAPNIRLIIAIIPRLSISTSAPAATWGEDVHSEDTGNTLNDESSSGWVVSRVKGLTGGVLVGQGLPQQRLRLPDVG
jgi:hypothetical protein